VVHTVATAIIAWVGLLFHVSHELGLATTEKRAEQSLGQTLVSACQPPNFVGADVFPKAWPTVVA
jgi:hypothetical protein